MDDYLKDPEAIERQSFALIRKKTDLSGFDPDQQQIVMRLVHTCGNPDIAKHARISKGAISAGIDALDRQYPVLCDVEMVRHGLPRRYLENEVHCYLNEPDVPKLAKAAGESRTMTALRFWEPCLENSIALIGNAPTALFRFMEMLESGMPRPALVIGIPVGFVGAPESKDYLWNNHQSLGVECITVLGRTGGSALTAGAFNTLVRLQRGLTF